VDFDLTDEQRLLKDSVDRLIADNYQFDQRKRYLTEPDGWSRAIWQQYADLGLLGLPFAIACGGFGGGPVDTMIVMEAFGRGLVLEPYFATVVLGGSLLRRAGTLEQQQALLPLVAQGRLRLAFAQVERQSRYDLADVVTTARQVGATWVLNGAKSVVLHGDCADRLLVTGRVSGDRRDPKGIGLFMVNPSAPGLVRRGYPTQDGLRAAEITLSDVRVPLDDVLGDAGGALPAIEHAIDEAVAALCAEAVGIMQAMHETTLEYLRTRHQFGRPIGQFQVLQHRSVDMLVALEQARSMAMFAAVMAAEENASERRRAIAAAKVQIGTSGRLIGQEAIQLHGGIGMTMEYKIGHYFKRMTMIDKMFGDADVHLSILGELGGLFGNARIT
jgi:pimeloyl-CoA dehydrogenase small subunit